MSTLNLTDIQRLLINDESTGWGLGASFPYKAGNVGLNFTAAAVGGETLADLVDLLEPDQLVKGAWDCAGGGAGYAAGDPVYLSFAVGAGLSRKDLQIWHFDGADWTAFDAMDLTCNDGWASFTISDFGTYAVTAVPEPGTSALLAAALVCAVICVWRKRR